MSESRKDLAGELWEHRDDPEEWGEEAEEIGVKPRRSSVVSFRLPPQELDALEQAMEQTGESLSEYIRGALYLRRALYSDDPHERERAVAFCGNVTPGAGTKGAPRRMAHMVSVRLDGELIGKLRAVAKERNATPSDLLKEGAELVAQRASGETR